MFAAMMWIDALFYQPSYTGPLSNATHGADFSWIFGLIVSAVVYYVLSFGSVKEELELTEVPGAFETGKEKVS